jgi:hypothetical protein
MSKHRKDSAANQFSSAGMVSDAVWLQKVHAEYHGEREQHRTGLVPHVCVIP